MPVDGTLTTIIVLVLIAGGLILLFRRKDVALTKEGQDRGEGGEEGKRD